ncbi:MAG: 2-C-methyl-D-erythritol 4-phosphate cytidylyltransferase [Saprospiraceae bacterium]|jgi:2-C-methyl-D-erythritol 4-phosphate cytidylyltransferase
MEKYVVIVAGGKGLRMGGEIPKQFFLLKGRPVLMHTIEKFTSTYSDINVIVVLPENQATYWKSLCKEHEFTVVHKITVGGNTRFHSVKNGLDLVSDGLVAIHDAVRPLVSKQTIETCFNEAEKMGNAVPVIPINDSMRQLQYEINKHVDREQFKIVQTPQVFQTSILKKAIEQGYQEYFTDDASVIEANRITVNLVEGNFENIKITRPSDLKMAEFLCEQP